MWSRARPRCGPQSVRRAAPPPCDNLAPQSGQVCQRTERPRWTIAPQPEQVWLVSAGGWSLVQPVRHDGARPRHVVTHQATGTAHTRVPAGSAAPAERRAPFGWSTCLVPGGQDRRGDSSRESASRMWARRSRGHHALDNEHCSGVMMAQHVYLDTNVGWGVREGRAWVFHSPRRAPSQSTRISRRSGTKATRASSALRLPSAMRRMPGRGRVRVYGRHGRRCVLSAQVAGCRGHAAPTLRPSPRSDRRAGMVCMAFHRAVGQQWLVPVASHVSVKLMPSLPSADACASTRAPSSIVKLLMVPL